jgi:putative two-component system response regulator
MINQVSATAPLVEPISPAEIKAKVLIVDDEPQILSQVAIWLQRNKFQPFTVDNALDALKLVRANAFDLVVCDINMPNMNGLEFLNQLKLIDPTLASVVITGDGRVSMAVKAMKSGALAFVPKPFTPAELMEAIKNATEKARIMREAFEMEFYVPLLQSACTALLKAYEAKDKDSEGHTERVADHATRVATAMRLSSNEIQDVYLGALFHDIGKIGIHDDILLKAGPLTPEEFAEMAKHPEIGENIIRPVEGMENVAAIIRHHHERWDGFGYPDRLVAENIPIGARIVAIADCYDEIVTSRRYSESRSPLQAIAELMNGRGSQFDPLVTDLFIQLVKQYHQSQILSDQPIALG